MAQGGAAGPASGSQAAGREESFSFTLALVVPVPELQAWFDSAAPGDSAIYASGFVLPREAEAVALVQRWIDAGEVRTHQRRDPLDARRWQFIVVRCDTRRARGWSRPIWPVIS